MWLWDIFRAIGRGFKKVFGSKEAQAALFTIVNGVLPQARPIVESIRAIVKSPTQATVPEIIDLYKQFGVVINDIADDPKAKANALLNLATDLLRDVLPEQYDTPLLESAITMALAALKAEGK